MSQDFDHVCLKVHLHPMHHVISKMLEMHFKRNGGNSGQSIASILQSKTTLAINGNLWKDKISNRAVLVIANGILLIADKESKEQLVQPCSFKSVRSITIAHN